MGNCPPDSTRRLTVVWSASTGFGLRLLDRAWYIGLLDVDLCFVDSGQLSLDELQIFLLTMTRSKDIVVLVHGLGGTRLDMWPISRRLKRVGFEVNNWGYRSIWNRIETHADRLTRELALIDSQLHEAKFHLVTHSMGGIIARSVFENVSFENLGRVVMLAPPHRGSHAARKLTPLFGWLTPSLKQLSDDPDSYVNSLSNSLQQNGIEFGIVEAKKDRVINPGAVHLDGYRDFSTVDGHHGVLTWYSHTIELIESFLFAGNFSAAATQPELS